MILVDTFVAGRPKTKGSLVVRPNGSAHESVIGSPTWRALMAGAVKDDIARRHPEDTAALTLPFSGPVRVVLTAHLPPPADPGPAAPSIRQTWYRRAMEALARWPIWPIWDQAGDVDKLARNVLDAIASNNRNPRYNGGAIEDDNQVCVLFAVKGVATDVRPSGVHLFVETLDESAMHGRLVS